MMGIGQFVFALQTLAYQELQRKTAWRHASNARVGARAGRQYVGPGDDTITLSGVVLPEIAGQPASIDQLRDMANAGSAYPLVDGSGRVYGAYVIEDISETGSLLTSSGSARRIEFSMQLQRVDDDLTASAGQSGGMA